MVNTFIQSKSYSSGDTSTTPHTLTFNAPPAAGSDVVIIGHLYNGRVFTGISGLGATWEQVSYVKPGSWLTGLMWLGRGCNGVDSAVTVTLNSTDRVILMGYEFDSLGEPGTPSTYGGHGGGWGPSGVTAGLGSVVFGAWHSGYNKDPQPTYTFTDYGGTWTGDLDRWMRSPTLSRVHSAYLIPTETGNCTRTVAENPPSNDAEIAAVVAFTQPALPDQMWGA